MEMQDLSRVAHIGSLAQVCMGLLALLLRLVLGPMGLIPRLQK